jgi:hypothetical protein
MQPPRCIHTHTHIYLFFMRDSLKNKTRKNKTYLLQLYYPKLKPYIHLQGVQACFLNKILWRSYVKIKTSLFPHHSPFSAARFFAKNQNDKRCQSTSLVWLHYASAIQMRRYSRPRFRHIFILKKKYLRYVGSARCTEARLCFLEINSRETAFIIAKSRADPGKSFCIFWR